MFKEFLGRNIGHVRADRKHSYSNRNRAQADSLQTRLQLGERIICAIREECGDEFADVVVRKQSACRMPDNFWKRFVHDVLSLEYCTRQRLRCYRALALYIERRESGPSVRAMRGLDAPAAKRFRGLNGKLGRTKAADGLSWALLQVFVDEFQILRSRTDSVMLLKIVKELRADLLYAGWTTDELPNLEDAAGRMWLRRWRVDHKISYKVCGMQLKVAWSKVCSRTRTLLTNIFRVKAFYKKLHPDGELKFLSADQKPSWFNNCGSLKTLGKNGAAAPTIKENHHQTRQRYSLFTFMQSCSNYGPGSDDEPPHLFILFKGKPNGRILDSVLQKTNLPPWLIVQCQEQGSYREADVEPGQTILTWGGWCCVCLRRETQTRGLRKRCI